MPRAKSSKTVEERLNDIEDYIDIVQVLNAYGPAADATHWDFLKEILADDCVFVTANMGSFDGHLGLRRMFETDFHKSLVNSGSGRVSSSPYVIVEGDQAVATNYFTLYQHRADTFPVIRLVATRWELARRSQGWVIVRRTNAALDGSPQAAALFSRVNEGPSSASETA